MDYGITLFPASPLERLRDWARLAEDSGFDYLGIADSQSLGRDIYVALAQMAGATERIHLGPTVTNPLTRHPAVTASAIASIEELAPGRVFLGFGSGDSAVLNLGLRPARVAQMREFLAVMRDLLQGKASGYQGQTVHTQWVRASIPLVMAAEGPKTLQTAGELADAVMIHGGLTPEILQDTVAAIRNAEREAGRPAGTVRTWAFAKCNVSDSRDQAIDEVKMALAASAHHAFRFTLEGKRVPPDLEEPIARLMREYVPTEHEQAGKTRNAALPDELGITDYLARRFGVIGTPEECRDQIETIAAQGIDTLIFTAIGPDPEAILRRLSADVLPTVRAARP